MDVETRLTDLALSRTRARGGQRNEWQARYLPACYGRALRAIADGLPMAELTLAGLDRAQTEKLVRKLEQRGLVSRVGYVPLSDRGGKSVLLRVTDPEARAILGLRGDA